MEDLKKVKGKAKQLNQAARLGLLITLLLSASMLMIKPAATATRVVIVTAGQSNAHMRIDDGGLARDSGWDGPLWNRQNPMIQQTLGLTQVDDIGNVWDSGRMTAVGGCNLMRSAGACHFVDDLSSPNPQNWRLSDVGVQLAAQINYQANKQDVAFISWIQGEADSHSMGDVNSMPGSYHQGGPYQYNSQAEWANHYKEVLKALLRLVRQETGLSNLRMAVQPIANYDGPTDLIRQAQIDAADESSGAIIIGNGNPWHYFEPLNSNDWNHYSGRAYMDFAFETGRVIARALSKAGVRGTANGPSYGEFPRVTGVSLASDRLVDVSVSNPNGASTLLLPSSNPTQGWKVYANGEEVAVTGISLAAPFKIRLQMERSVSGSVGVTYGTQDRWTGRWQGITDNAATTAPAEPGGMERRNMPLMIKPTPRASSAPPPPPPTPTPTPIQTPTPTPTPTPAPTGFYQLEARHSGKCLDVNEFSSANGAAIQQWDCHSGQNQQWKLEDVGNGYYRLTARHSGKALDVSSVSTANGAVIHQWDYVGGANQQWKLENIGGGYYRLIARHSGKALDVSGVSYNNGAIVHQWDYVGGANQQWLLRSVQ